MRLVHRSNPTPPRRPRSLARLFVRLVAGACVLTLGLLLPSGSIAGRLDLDRHAPGATELDVFEASSTEGGADQNRDGAEQKPAEEAVQDSWVEFKAAVLLADGHAAADKVNKKTIEYFGRLQQLILYADEATLQREPVVDQLTVLTLRALSDPKALRNATPRELVAYSLGQLGYLGGTSYVDWLSIDVITADDGIAHADLLMDGEPLWILLFFEREDEDWKLDLASLADSEGVNTVQYLKHEGIRSRQYLDKYLEEWLEPESAELAWVPIVEQSKAGV